MKHVVLIIVFIFSVFTCNGQNSLEQKTIDYLIGHFFIDKDDYPNFIKIKLKPYKYIENTTSLFTQPFCFKKKQFWDIQNNLRRKNNFNHKKLLHFKNLKLLNTDRNKQKKTKIQLQFHQRVELKDMTLITLSIIKKKEWIEYFVFKYDKEGNYITDCSTASLL